MSCEEKPNFVIVKKTNLGFSFDNNVTYKSPLSSHTLSQASGASHPSLQVKSNWGINPKNTITQLLTGNAAAKFIGNVRGHIGSKELLLKEKTSKINGKKTLTSRFGLIAPTGNNSGYTLTRIGNRNEALSVAELSILLNDISKNPRNIKVRGSPLEYKRLLDYIQFLMVEKVTNDDKLFLVRPNNYHVMDAVHTNGISLENAYTGIDENNSKMYGKAYFVTMDRVAALASVVRQIPTIYQTGESKKNPDMSQVYFKLAPITNIIPRIRKILANILTAKRYIMSDETRMNNYTNRIHKLTTPNGRPVITSGPLFAWFLDTRNVSEKTNTNGKIRTIGSNFHELSPEDKALILFYWVFNYPDSTDGNINVIKYFLAILDTFHDFAGGDRVANFKNIWPESMNEKSHLNARNKTHNGISNQNIPLSSKQHKFLVKLLGIDIYRKVGNYNNNIVNTLSKTNKRGSIPIQLRVGHFLYFITNVLGSQASRELISACEILSRTIMITLANDTPINKRFDGSRNMCKFLEEEKACVVIDAISGSVPTCVKKYSVFHNVGILDPTDKGVLSWGEVIGEGGCVESKKVEEAKKAKAKAIKAILNSKKTMKERSEKAQEMRLNRLENEATAAAKAKINSTANAIKNKQNRDLRAKAREKLLAQEKVLKMQRYRNNLKKFLNTLQLSINNKKFFMSNLKNDNLFKLRKLAQEKANNNMIVNARAQLNKLTSLTQIQKNNYIQQIRQNPKSIPIILNNAKRVANTRRVTRSQTIKN